MTLYQIYSAARIPSNEWDGVFIWRNWAFNNNKIKRQYNLPTVKWANANYVDWSPGDEF